MQRIVLDLVSTLPLVPSHLRYLAFSGGYLSSPFFLGLIGFSNYRTRISDSFFQAEDGIRDNER
eukprot:COSAG01_NODE_14192_length_1485_cov_0.677489_2_plen_64_part_00